MLVSDEFHKAANGVLGHLPGELDPFNDMEVTHSEDNNAAFLNGGSFKNYAQRRKALERNEQLDGGSHALTEEKNKKEETRRLLLKQTVAHQLAVLNAKIAEIDDRISDIDARIFEIDAQISEIDARIFEIDQNNAELEIKIEETTQALAETNEQLEINNDAIIQTEADRQEVCDMKEGLQEQCTAIDQEMEENGQALETKTQEQEQTLEELQQEEAQADWQESNYIKDAEVTFNRTAKVSDLAREADIISAEDASHGTIIYDESDALAYYDYDTQTTTALSEEQAEKMSALMEDPYYQDKLGYLYYEDEINERIDRLPEKYWDKTKQKILQKSEIDQLQDRQNELGRKSTSITEKMEDLEKRIAAIDDKLAQLKNEKKELTQTRDQQEQERSEYTEKFEANQQEKQGLTNEKEKLDETKQGLTDKRKELVELRQGFSAQKEKLTAQLNLGAEEIQQNINQTYFMLQAGQTGISAGDISPSADFNVQANPIYQKVTTVQTALQDLGHYSNKYINNADGILGPRTNEAFCSFLVDVQKQGQLDGSYKGSVDGLYGPMTARSLEEQIDKLRASNNPADQAKADLHETIYKAIDGGYDSGALQNAYSRPADWQSYLQNDPTPKPSTPETDPTQDQTASYGPEQESGSGDSWSILNKYPGSPNAP